MATPRVPPRPEEDWDDAARAVLEPLRAAGGGRLLNIFGTLAHHPELMRRWLVFGNHVLAKSTLAPRERELAILRVGWLCGSDYEYGQHVLIGKGVGLSDEECARVVEGPDAAGWSDLEALVLRAADELHADSRIGDATWEGLQHHLDLQQCLDLVFAVGQYHLVSMALNTLGVERDAGVPGFPEASRGARSDP